MSLREVKLDDIKEIERIYAKHHADTFGLFNTNNSLGHAISGDENKILAFGAIKLLAEAMIVLDLSLPKTARTKAVIELLEAAIANCKKLEIEQLHAFVKDEHFAKLLIERFKFARVEDIPLVLNIG